ncbi:MAG TPA: site-specific DNA-methyltransferase [Candidatus Magasanikbacteria bacterium]|jgi:site-specific DNA-methyltransferase (adenine-specific)|nr:site-specific DNA-methyltransferase [Endomicrobiaceae bacterium]GMX58296.1 MAG: site-specific DNA-methyltransferase [Candidatus Yanofskybacteria bacterium]HNU96319.1 site-specific DNA-methyltransferase [Candidatus Magasanikbacteria bacterium]
MANPYYEKPKFKLYQANCLDILNELPESSVDMIFADPPYFLSSGSFTCQNGKMVSVKKGDWDLSNGLKKNFEFQNEWIKACRRVLKPNGTIWISGTYHSIYQCGFALQINKFHILNDIAWFKPNASPNLSCRLFTASHETLLWARKEEKSKHTFRYEKMRDWKENYKKNFICKHTHKEEQIDFLHQKGKQMRSVWAINTPSSIEKKFGKHPTQKPEALLWRVVLSSTKKGDLVLDPFTGSSTTGLVAYLYGRNFVGIDTEKQYLDLSIKRFEELDKNIKNKRITQTA